MATSYVSWIELERSFVMPFTLGHPKECVYVVSIENITDPLYVFKDYGNDGLIFFAHYLTNVGVLILEIEFFIDLIFVYISCFWGEEFQCGSER